MNTCRFVFEVQQMALLALAPMGRVGSLAERQQKVEARRLVRSAIARTYTLIVDTATENVTFPKQREALRAEPPVRLAHRDPLHRVVRDSQRNPIGLVRAISGA
jgi:hypothetical protein